MTRPLHIEFAGALYHITSRGDRQKAIYEDDEDRKAFFGVPCEEQWYNAIHDYLRSWRHPEIVDSRHRTKLPEYAANIMLSG
jgi:putative transposase